MKKQIKIEHLIDYYEAELRVAKYMKQAIDAHDVGNENGMYAYLFDWCMAKDSSNKTWKKLEPHFLDALFIKAGHGNN